MPDLPTLTVTQVQMNRMLAAYAPAPGATQAETAAAYKEWLRARIVDFVLRFELGSLRSTNFAEELALEADVKAVLPAPPPVP